MTNTMSKSNFFVFVLFLFLGSMNLVRSEEINSAEESLTNEINTLGCTLLNSLDTDAAPEENILVSPINVYTALALLYLGAGEKTRKELASVMHLPENIENSTEVHRELSALISKLILKRKSDDSKLQDVTLTNGIFLQKNFLFKTSYLESARRHYDTQLETLDFLGGSYKSTELINNWISNSTKGRIGEFYKQPLLPSTVAVLVSALYFRHDWLNSFPPENTKNGKFYTGAKEIEVPMMYEERLYHYARDYEFGYAAVSLPYSGDEYEMMIYLPDVGYANDTEYLVKLCHRMAPRFQPRRSYLTLLKVKIPKMKFSSKVSLIDALGLDTILQHSDFGEMTSNENVKFTSMTHATELEVDESGTAAAAVSDGWFERISGGPPPFHAKRPFLLVIKHKPTDTILFLGIVRKPIE